MVLLCFAFSLISLLINFMQLNPSHVHSKVKTLVLAILDSIGYIYFSFPRPWWERGTVVLKGVSSDDYLLMIVCGKPT